jgi:hypothetical protein
MVCKVFRLYTFSRGINIPLVHPSHGVTKRNYKQWLSKGFNNKQWQTILAIMQKEGAMLFAGGAGSLNGQGWQTQAHEKFQKLTNYSISWPRFYTWS